MRFGILFAAACLSFGATVQAAVIPNGDDNGLVAQAQSIQGNKQNKDYQPQGGIAIAKRQVEIEAACQRLNALVSSFSPTLESVVASCTGFSAGVPGRAQCPIVTQALEQLGESGIQQCNSAGGAAGANGDATGDAGANGDTTGGAGANNDTTGGA
ncbi:hypothetical protein EC973_006311 [Apophysomyces ossiformis]|uniref:Uncharacterized protein n=1 Tax=Apophysomyces ossiformis TaxID=679940 RepID=A0A8H7EJT5_9FUNG|nr:hypothetical protein EC973_006311 [Apophysomyces ossiformis]